MDGQYSWQLRLASTCLLRVPSCKKSKRMLKASEASCGFDLASRNVSLLELTDSEDFPFVGAFCHALKCPVDGLKLTSTLSKPYPAGWVCMG